MHKKPPAQLLRVQRAERQGEGSFQPLENLNRGRKNTGDEVTDQAKAKAGHLVKEKVAVLKGKARERKNDQRGASGTNPQKEEK